ncbi:MAG TPA: cupin domain-containing protein [Alphaproteobacteria bacterium]
MTTARKPIKKSLSSIQKEEAHGGSGSRQVIFSPADQLSSQFEAWTKGYLPAGASYDWHQHDAVDEFFIVLEGTGYIEYKDGTKFDYKKDDTFCNPAGLAHKIENTGTIESIFYFFRLKE